MKKPRKPIIAITVGDHNGIGPEVALKCVLQSKVRRLCFPLLIGSFDVFRFYAKRFRLPIELVQIDGDALPQFKDWTVPVLSPGKRGQLRVKPGTLSASAGKHAADAIRLASSLASQQHINAIVTAPVSKKGLHKAGIAFDGQTEFLQHLTSSRHVAMMLVSKTMRVGLATVHVPINQVARRLTREKLRSVIEVVHSALKNDWRIPKPRIAVLGLNPHAGEQGDIGREEQKVIFPVIEKLKNRRWLLEGPFPADSFFGKYTPGTFDAVVAMYHDQGLIPLKMSSFGSAVNYSAGLPIVRTSPDHGTAFDIAGKGFADPGSMVAAIELAVFIANNRKRTTG